ncbi:Piso0_002002 [Millerozyma farinosa CBS 7064]|uniref:Piso0_002002 protein n=1 Tax=Pichia sorbitophila (strain ATCC MYA-4447 / BCRC 22081 / CBS 7064 / NBRC 10061 / NRRL Y-12695) TaxID=559304 RepID=G8YM98_PICSO|nr:Piso0_002002 [Millerozyma farinosa CBS 7064]
MLAAQQDPTQPLEPYLKKLLSSLDLQYQSPSQQFANIESYATQFGKSLKPSTAIVINGKPVIAPNNDAKLEFQKKWLMTPLTTHQLNSFDAHLIPGTGVFVINASGKVRFDESGRNRLGETADLQNIGDVRGRSVWGSWFGFNINLVVDESVVNGAEEDTINSYNYRFTYKPDDSVVQI